MTLTIAQSILSLVGLFSIVSIFWLAWTWLQSTRVKVGLRRNGKWVIYLKFKESYLWKVYQVDGVVLEFETLTEANQVCIDRFNSKYSINALDPDTYKPKPVNRSWY